MAEGNDDNAPERSAPPSFVTVAQAGELADGEVKPVVCNGRVIALCRDRGKYFAVDARCLHQGGNLADGIVSRGHIICPVHGWRFALATGKHEMSENAVPTYAVRVDGDLIQIDPRPRRRAP